MSLMYVYMHTHTRATLCVHMHVCASVCGCVCVCARACVHARACLSIISFIKFAVSGNNVLLIVQLALYVL